MEPWRRAIRLPVQEPILEEQAAWGARESEALEVQEAEVWELQAGWEAQGPGSPEEQQGTMASVLPDRVRRPQPVLSLFNRSSRQLLLQEL
jgi:hypothetical protein